MKKIQNACRIFCRIYICPKKALKEVSKSDFMDSTKLSRHCLIYNKTILSLLKSLYPLEIGLKISFDVFILSCN